VPTRTNSVAPEPAPDDAPEKSDNIDDLRRQMKDMQDRLERMSKDTTKTDE
jgi:hypothetical protein